MNLTERWERFWRRLAGEVVDRADILRILQEGYREKSRIAAQMKVHAQAAHYEEFQKRLEAIASHEEEHARMLSEKILELGGTVSENAPVIKTGHNFFESLQIDLEDEKAFHLSLIEHINRLQGSPAKETLEHIHLQEERHLEALKALVARTQAYTGNWKREEFLLA